MGRKEIGDNGDALVNAASMLASLGGPRSLDLVEPDRRVLVVGVDR
ncbi:hypothetical protein RCH16_003658 [Cryobacterium sp. MP_M5]|nr:MULTISPECIES: hypothetical protein [unclassified Cryobacterium]MBG6060182.1 hypothetical protein [Cryobacterium sp. MP_M3]MEC5178618.1 hypothetical protein [Cryobacterium sp. MP_M5]